jgi:predicted  nucleic acid-binding Zn-ribbon protein
MGVEEWVSLGGAIGIVPALQWAWRRVRRDPKTAAETRKLNADASRTEWQTLSDEIKRLDRDLAEVRTELAAVKETAADEKAALERENKALRTKVQRLTLRVQGLEDILKVKPLPPEMQAMLDKLDEETGRGAAS